MHVDFMLYRYMTCHMCMQTVHKSCGNWNQVMRCQSIMCPLFEINVLLGSFYRCVVAAWFDCTITTIAMLSVALVYYKFISEFWHI